MKRRTGNIDAGKPPRRQSKRTAKFADSVYGSSYIYVKFVLAWAFIIFLDFILEFRFEYLWPLWLLIQSCFETFKCQGLVYSMFFVCIAITSDTICFLFIPINWLFFVASTYVWVHYIWHTEKGVCLPTALLWFFFMYIEAAFRLKDLHNSPFHIELCRPFAAHCIGHPFLTLGIGFKSYISYRLRVRTQRQVQKENNFYYELLKGSLPAPPPQQPANHQLAITDKEKGEAVTTNGGVHITTSSPSSKKHNHNNHKNHKDDHEPSSATATSGGGGGGALSSLRAVMTTMTSSSSKHGKTKEKASEHKEPSAAAATTNTNSTRKHHQSRHRNNHVTSNNNNGGGGGDDASVVTSSSKKKHVTSSSSSSQHQRRSTSQSSSSSDLHSSSTGSNSKSSNSKTSKCNKHSNNNNSGDVLPPHTTTAPQQAENGSSGNNKKTRNKSPTTTNPAAAAASTTNASSLPNGHHSNNAASNSNGDKSTPRIELVSAQSLIEKLEATVSKLNAELAHMRKSDHESRGKIELVTNMERVARNELKRLTEEHESLQTKYQNLCCGKQKDKLSLQSMEKRLEMESRSRSSTEKQLHDEIRRYKEKEESAKNQQQQQSSKEKEECDQLRVANKNLENEFSTMQSNLKRKEEAFNVLKKEQMQQREKSVKESETLMSALEAMQEKNAMLENSLSAETKIKLDLFSALGDAKRQLEIAHRHILKRDSEVAELKSRMTEMVSVMPNACVRPSTPHYSTSFLEKQPSYGTTPTAFCQRAMPPPAAQLVAQASVPPPPPPPHNQLNHELNHIHPIHLDPTAIMYHAPTSSSTSSSAH